MELRQSAIRRAINDTLSAQKSARFMWGGEGMLAGAGVASLSAMAPTTATTFEIVLRAVLGGLGGLVVAMLSILAWNLFRAPYKQRDEALQKQKELETKSENIKLFDITCQKIIALPVGIDWRIISAVKLGFKPIEIVYRGDLPATITTLIMSPQIGFTQVGAGWQSTNIIQITTGDPPWTALRAKEFAWNIQNSRQWELKGLPLTLAKNQSLELPWMWLSFVDRDGVEAHFKKGETCTLVMEFSMRTDKGFPELPKQTIKVEILLRPKEDAMP